MKSFVLAIACITLTNIVIADVNDTATNREFYTRYGTCRIVAPKSDHFIFKEQVKPNGTAGYYALASEKKLINYSFYIEANKGACDSNSKCVDSVLRNKAYEKAKDLKRYEHGGFSVAEFNIEFPGKDGATIIQKNVLAESYKGGYWVDIHLSRLGVDSPGVGSILSVLDDLSIQR